MNEKHYLLTIYGDVEPALTGPLETHEEVLARAKEHRAEDPEMEDGLFILGMDADGVLHVDAFGGDELEDEEDQ